MNRDDRFKKASSLFYADCFSNCLNFSQHEDAGSLEEKFTVVLQSCQHLPRIRPTGVGNAGVRRAHITQLEQAVNSRPLPSTDPMGRDGSERCASQASPAGGRSLHGVMFVRPFEISLMVGRDLQISGDIGRMSSSAALKSMFY